MKGSTGIALLVAAGTLLNGCSNGAASPAPAVMVNVASGSKLQLGVGTATINTDAGSLVGTNFTMTFRGTDGNNATGVNTPTLTGPPSFRVGFPGSPNSIHGLTQLAYLDYAQSLQGLTSGSYQTDFYESLGPYAGVFGYGMANDNLVSSQLSQTVSDFYQASTQGSGCSDLLSSGNPTINSANVESTLSLGVASPGKENNTATGTPSSNEIGLPIGSANVNQANPGCVNAVAASATVPLFQGPPNTSVFPVNYYGGPPAWPSPQGYGAPTFFVGFGLGFSDIAVAPVPGTYTLDVAYPTSADYSTSAHVLASAHLRAIAPLPLMPKPSLRIDADGSGIVSINVPPGLFETIVVVRSNDCRTPSSFSNNFAQVTHTSGPQNIMFAANLGPPDRTGVPTRTFCAQPAGLVSALGFDYPAYESSYPFDTTEAPKITNGDGHNGQADVTTSPPLMFPSQAGLATLRGMTRMTRRK